MVVVTGQVGVAVEPLPPFGRVTIPWIRRDGGSALFQHITSPHKAGKFVGNSPMSYR